MTMPCVIPSYGDEPPADVVFIRVEPYTGVDLEFLKSAVLTMTAVASQCAT